MLIQRTGSLDLLRDDATKGADSLEILEAYRDDKYLPSFLVGVEVGGRAFNAQIATDVEARNVRVVTIYIPVYPS